MENGRDSLFEARLKAALKAQPRASLPSDFAARMRVKAEATFVPSTLQKMFSRPAFAAGFLSRAQYFMAATLFIASFAAGSIYSDSAYTQTASSSTQTQDPLLNSLYYAHQRIL